MRKISIMALFAVATLASCNSDKNFDMIEPTTPQSENFEELYAKGWAEREGQSARLTLNFEASEPQMSRATATPQEQEINNLNLYLFNPEMDLSQHLYTHDIGALTLPITPGEWHIYAIANIGMDMGSMSEEQTQNYNYEIVSEENLATYGFVMTHQSTFSIGTTNSLDILFERAVARIDLRVDVTSAAVNIERVKLVNVPKCSRLFSNGNTPSSQELMTYEYRICGNGSMPSFYMLENLAGVSSQITSEKDKTQSNAPSTASYIEIEGTTSSAWVTYRIYLGRNNTSDFNIERNTIYDVDATIYGANESDMRVEVRYFALDVNVVMYGTPTMHEYYKKHSSEMFATISEVDLTVTARIDKTLRSDISVVFEAMVMGESGYTPYEPIVDIDWVIVIPAGSLQATATIQYAPFFSNTAKYARLVEVVTSDPTDMNNYYVDSNVKSCSVTSSLEVTDDWGE